VVVVVVARRPMEGPDRRLRLPRTSRHRRRRSPAAVVAVAVAVERGQRRRQGLGTAALSLRPSAPIGSIEAMSEVIEVDGAIAHLAQQSTSRGGIMDRGHTW